MSGMQHASTIIIIIPMIFGSLWVQQSNFSINLEKVMLVSRPIQSLQLTSSLKPGNTRW